MVLFIDVDKFSMLKLFNKVLCYIAIPHFHNSVLCSRVIGAIGTVVLFIIIVTIFFFIMIIILHNKSKLVCWLELQLISDHSFLLLACIARNEEILI